MEETIVKEWLRSLKLDYYAESFIDNGYDDLEICKQIDEPDLDAIGVVDISHRKIILHAVQILKVEGAASVYFTVEEAQAATQDTISRNSDPGPNYEKSKKPGTSSTASTPGERPLTQLYHGLSSNDIDAYEAGRAELVRFPQLQLRQLIQESLIKDNVNLTIYPYTTQEGERGVLEGLASRYADVFNTHFQDVLEHLEYLRAQEYCKILASGKSKYPNQKYGFQCTDQLDNRQTDIFSPHSSSSSLGHNDDYPIYLPGKYNPSSCLSDAEEDQIYGFVTGSKASISVPTSEPDYLNPRSQCIYELPPSRVRHSSQNGMKKKLGLGRLLKTLKRDLKRSTDTKPKTYISHPIPITTRPICGPIPQDLSSTPLVILPGYSSPTSSHCSQSSKSHSSGQSCIVNSASAPGTPGSSGPVIKDSGIQNCIEKLKEQEIKRRREEQFREHEQILHDIRQGLEQTKSNMMKGTTRETTPTYSSNELPCNPFNETKSQNKAKKELKRHSGGDGQPHPLLFQHWYDEPPYESDPEEFLIGKENSRFVGNQQHRFSKDEDVISLKTAGDITIPRDAQGQNIDISGPQHHMESQESEKNRKPDIIYDNRLQGTNYPESKSQNDCQDKSQRNCQRSKNISKLPINSYSEQLSKISPIGCQSIGKSQQPSNVSIEMMKERRSEATSDYEDESERTDSDTLVGKMKVLQRDMQKKISRLKIGSREGLNFSGDSTSSSSSNRRKKNDDLFREKLEATYSCYQRQNSLPVKLKTEKEASRSQQLYGSEETQHLYVIGSARALVDHDPSPYDKEALPFKKGDYIDIIAKYPSGIWKGHVNDRIGNFKFVLVEEVTNERSSRRYGISSQEGQNLWLYRISSLQELLTEFQLTHITQVLVMNGIRDLERFRNLSPEDLDQLGIADYETRSRILAAIGFILDLEEYEGYTMQNWPQKSTFIRHTNGRVSLPVLGFNPSYAYTGQQNYGAKQIEGGYQLYENASSYLCQDENNLDHSIHSSSSTDTSSGYHSRPTFNIPLGTAHQHCSSGSKELQKGVSELSQKSVYASHSSALSPSDGHRRNTQSDSYHAEVARVHSSPSTSPCADTFSLESTSC